MNAPAEPLENPVQFLERMRGKCVQVVLKWGTVYRGSLLCYDKYMNLVIKDAIETTAEGSQMVGDTCVRCNNVRTIEDLSSARC